MLGGLGRTGPSSAVDYRISDDIHIQCYSCNIYALCYVFCLFDGVTIVFYIDIRVFGGYV